MEVKLKLTAVSAEVSHEEGLEVGVECASTAPLGSGTEAGTACAGLVAWIDESSLKLPSEVVHGVMCTNGVVAWVGSTPISLVLFFRIGFGRGSGVSLWVGWNRANEIIKSGAETL